MVLTWFGNNGCVCCPVKRANHDRQQSKRQSGLSPLYGRLLPFLVGVVAAKPIFSMASSLFGEEEQENSFTITAPYSSIELEVVTGISHLPERMRELHASLAEASLQYELALSAENEARALETTIEPGAQLPTYRFQLLKGAMDSILRAEATLENASNLHERVHRDVATIVNDAEPYALERLMARPDFVSARNEIDSLGAMIEGLLPDLLELRYQVIDLMCRRS